MVFQVIIFVLFIGGTGFVGKILIEKLLRSCPELASLLIIIRPKKGQNVESRIKQIFNEPVSVSQSLVFFQCGKYSTSRNKNNGIFIY